MAASQDFDVLIVGSGLAGLSAALHLAPTHRVAVLTKRELRDGSSGWAQGTPPAGGAGRALRRVRARCQSGGGHVDETGAARGRVRDG